MAYINRETSERVRKALAAEFPEIEFSVRASGSNNLIVSIMASPYFEDGAAFGISPYWLSIYFKDQQLAVLKKIDQIVWEVCGWDEDDNPYADRRFKYSMTVGNRNKPHVNTAKVDA